MQSLKYYIKNPGKIGVGIMRRMHWLPDKLYLRLLFYFEMGSLLNLKHPKTFQEKLQWLKLYNRNPDHTKLVDKYAVKEYVKELIGPEYIIPTLGVWDSFDDIDFASLPDKFVLKTTHGGGGGGVVICKDKRGFDKESAKRTLNKSLNTDIYICMREWPYENVRRRIIAEEFIDNPTEQELYDYKFFCFDGEPKFFKVDYNRFIRHYANYYTPDWNLLPLDEDVCPRNESKKISCPPNFQKMLEIARALSKGFPFLRVDLYNVNGKIYFGELTFFPASGLGSFSPKDWNLKLGNLLTLPILNSQHSQKK